MPIYLMDKAYKITTSGGVSAYHVVVASAAGQCELPAAANADKLLGVTVHDQTEQNRAVTVRKAGIAEVTASGAIAVGAPVNVADATGKVKAINETAGTFVNCLGFAETAATSDGDIIEVFLCPHQRTA